MFEKLLKWDRETFIYLNSLGIERYDAFWSLITHISTWIPLFLLFIFLLFWKNSKREGGYMALMMGLLILFVLALTHVTKLYVARLRPSNDEEINTLIRILQSPTDYSFYSGHASSSFAITTMLVFLLRNKIKWIWVFFLWPLLFSTSRIYVGVHFPIDIIVGAVVGMLCAWLFYVLYKKFKPPYLTSVRPE
jgi:undecaprenyl-diphosphatase